LNLALGTEGVDVQFKDRDELDDDSESNDGEKASPPNTTRIESKNKNKGKNPSGKSHPKKKKGKKCRRSKVFRRGRTTNEVPRVIVDPGLEIALVCAIAWTPVEQLSVNTQVFGAIQGSRGDQLSTVRAMTAYEHPTMGTVLLGAGNAAMTENPEQTESLLNSHVLRFNGVMVHDTTERDGGQQLVQVEDLIIKLDFKDTATLSFETRKPTSNELASLKIYWMIHKIPDKHSQLLRHARRRTASTILEPVPWEERLGNCPELLLAKTLEARTQLCTNPVDMENREAPQQHRKKQLLLLHPKRVIGRTDSDTFFSSVKSIANYTCVQLFFSVETKFLFAKCMRKESHSHGGPTKIL
jgi:hypothetical protein